jgi:UDP:flavonoid glycosyltransferase YjiC (YdhE family)
MRTLLTCRPLAGHYRPMLPLARALAEAGHDVAFASGEPVAGEAEAEGFTAFRVGLEVDSVEPLARRIRDRAASLPPSQIRQLIFAELFVRVELEPRANDLISVVEQWKPNLVIHDVAEFAGPLVATMSGVPYVEHSYGPAIQDGVIRAAGEAAAPSWSSRGLTPHPLGGFYRYLYLDVCPPSLQVPEPLTGVAQSIRTVETQPPATHLPWLDALRGLPLIYVTLGTVYNRNLDVFRALLAGLRDEALNIVITVGKQNDRATFGRQPSNVHVHQYIPQEQLLPHCAAVVTHGGAGSTLGALAFGLPLLVVPQGADHFHNAERVVAAGAGVQLVPDRLTADAVREAVRILLHDDTFRRAAQRIRNEFDAMPDPRQAVETLEQLAVREPPPNSPARGAGGSHVADATGMSLERATPPTALGRPPS